MYLPYLANRDQDKIGLFENFNRTKSDYHAKMNKNT